MIRIAAIAIVFSLSYILIADLLLFWYAII